MLYSVRMRAAQGGDHEQGGRHISGAERLLPAAEVAAAAAAMAERALSHTRGQADFINIQVELVPADRIKRVPLLPVQTLAVADYREGRGRALRQLCAAGIGAEAASTGMEYLLALADSLRGAMLVCARTGCRLDTAGQRGIRVSRMDSSDPALYRQQLTRRGLGGSHASEAMVLAAKVAAAPGVVAELCWSDDPEYTTGYVASRQGYIRITHLKPLGSPQGGRVFFIEPETDLAALVNYLQYEPVLVKPWEGGDGSC